MFITAEKLQKPVQATITLRSKDVHILCLRVFLFSFFVFVFVFCFFEGGDNENNHKNTSRKIL